MSPSNFSSRSDRKTTAGYGVRICVKLAESNVENYAPSH